jgi:VWFA-related protein
MVRWLWAGMVVCATLGVVAAGQQPVPPPTAAQQRPVFRGGTHFVRVDAYPTQDGKIVEGLGADDFEIFEDGKPQKIESFDFLKFETFTSQAVRRDPPSQRAGFDLASDPRYRVFVVFVDFAFSVEEGPHAPLNDIANVQRPLAEFLDRVLGPQDLFGFLTSRTSVKDLVLGQKSTVTEAQVADLFRSSFIDRDEADALDECPNRDALKRQHRADATYSELEGLVHQLGSIRQERKNIVLVTNELPRWKPDPSLIQSGGGNQPRVGIANGRFREGPPNTVGTSPDSLCVREVQRLALIDFDGRYGQLLKAARDENVSFYVVTPGGLRAPTIVNEKAVRRTTDDLSLLANETDGIAIVNTNDLSGGMKKIADDLAAYYLLGYYTTNTRFDGGLRSIKVRLKASGKTVRARRQYRAPTETEIAALAAGVGTSSSSSPASAAPAPPSPRELALIVLERASRPFSVYAAVAGRQLTVVTELSAASIQVGTWKDGADVEVVAVGADGTPLATAKGKIEPGSYATAIRLTPPSAWPSRFEVRLKGSTGAPADDRVLLPPASGTLVGDAVAYRAGSRIAPRPVAGFEFARNERIRVEWPVLSTLDRREVRLLDKTGKPLPVGLPLSEDPATHAVVVEMSLSGLGHGDYLIELTAGAGTATEKHLIALRIK